jgi:hypothetical protein
MMIWPPLAVTIDASQMAPGELVYRKINGASRIGIIAKWRGHSDQKLFVFFELSKDHGGEAYYTSMPIGAATCASYGLKYHFQYNYSIQDMEFDISGYMAKSGSIIICPTGTYVCVSPERISSNHRKMYMTLSSFELFDDLPSTNNIVLRSWRLFFGSAGQRPSDDTPLLTFDAGRRD